MDDLVLRWVEIVFLAIVIPVFAVLFRWARRVDVRVSRLENQVGRIADSVTRLCETLDEHDAHLTEVLKLVSSELGGSGIRDRLTRLEQKVADHLNEK